MATEIASALNSALESGIPIRVDLDGKNLTIGKRKVIVNGELAEGCVLFYPQKDTMSALKELKVLYERYKHSVPSERSERKARKHFYALPTDKLSDDDFVRADDRYESRIRLETELLFNVVIGNMVWDKSFGNWYYKDDDFVVLKKWF